jgi:CHAD domain-containing protein
MNKSRRKATSHRATKARCARPMPRPLDQLRLDETGPASDAPELGLLRALCPGETDVRRKLAEVLQERWRAYRKQLKACRKEFTMSRVHRLRVQIRRLMSSLGLIEQVHPLPSAGKACRILKRHLAALSDLRDAHVQLNFVEAKEALMPSPALRDYLRRCERRLAKLARRKVKGFRTAKLGRCVCRLQRDLSEGRRRRQVDLAFAVWQAMETAFDEVVRRRAAIDISDLRTIHRTRIAFKRFRYILEGSPLEELRPDVRQSLKMAACQRKMGHIQDTEVLLGVVGKFARKRKARRALEPFTRYLERRRARLVRLFMKSADDLLGFWPPSPRAFRAPLRSA